MDETSRGVGTGPKRRAPSWVLGGRPGISAKGTPAAARFRRAFVQRPSRFGCPVLNRPELARTILVGSFQQRDRSDSDGRCQTPKSGPEDHRGFKARVPSWNGLLRPPWFDCGCLKLSGNQEVT
jgi:hypothetical protein